MLVERIFIVSNRFFGVPSFFNYVIADGIYNLFYTGKIALRGTKPNNLDDFQLCFDFGLKLRKLQSLFLLTAYYESCIYNKTTKSGEDMVQLLPVYYQIKQTIKTWIVNKDFKPGEKIPSENELASQFNVSRLTVRQAIYQLVQEGFLKSKRGEGTFVTNNETLIDNFGLEFIGFMDDLLYQVSKVKTASAVLSRVPSAKFVSEKLELKENEEIICIQRVRFLRDKVFSYTVNYLPLQLGLKINEEELYKKPLLEIVEHDLGIQFTEAFQTIQASFANQEIADHLRIPSGSPILYIERIMYTKGKKPVEFVQSSHPGDMYKFIVRLKNVKSKNERVWVHKSGVQDTQK